MLSTRLVSMVLAVGLVLVLQGCAETSTQRMINANDHNGLAQYYTQQAQDLREKAKHWEHTAEYYEKHSDPHGKTEPKQHAAHCRAIAQNNLKAADEADALAQEHRAMHPHGMIQ
jgi:outer membrane protein assembly factor BamD (BamD/ComL family)